MAKQKAVILTTPIPTAEQLAKKLGISKKRFKELLAIAELAER